jgi:hypothetical protein
MEYQNVTLSLPRDDSILHGNLLISSGPFVSEYYSMYPEASHHLVFRQLSHAQIFVGVYIVDGFPEWLPESSHPVSKAAGYRGLS